VLLPLCLAAAGCSGGEVLVRVADLPDTDAYRVEVDGRAMLADVGYLYSRTKALGSRSIPAGGAGYCGSMTSGMWTAIARSSTPSPRRPASRCRASPSCARGPGGELRHAAMFVLVALSGIIMRVRAGTSATNAGAEPSSSVGGGGPKGRPRPGSRWRGSPGGSGRALLGSAPRGPERRLRRRPPERAAGRAGARGHAGGSRAGRKEQDRHDSDDERVPADPRPPVHGERGPVE